MFRLPPFPIDPAPGYKPYPEMVEALFKTMGSDPATLMHAAVGVMGEACEILTAVAGNDRENLIEEGGDAYFYIQKILTLYAFDPLSFATPADIEHTDTPEIEFVKAAGDLLDIVKKNWVYGKEIDLVVMCRTLGRVMYWFFDILNAHALDFAGVLEYNQIKLGRRYPNGVYSDTDAIVRADKEEEIPTPPAVPLELDPTHNQG